MNQRMIVLKQGILILIAVTLWGGCTKKPATPPLPNPGPQPAAPFNNIVVSGYSKITLVAGAANKIDTIFGAIIPHIRKHTLYLDGAGQATLDVNDLDTLISNGATEIDAPSNLNLHHVVIVGNGVSHMNLNLTASDSVCMLSNGAGPYTLTGSTPELHVYVNGVADFHGFGMISQNCTVSLAGAGMCITKEIHLQ
jgi:hypothetical protein